jgi:hypothetical protein
MCGAAKLNAENSGNCNIHQITMTLFMDHVGCTDRKEDLDVVMAPFKFFITEVPKILQ